VTDDDHFSAAAAGISRAEQNHDETERDVTVSDSVFCEGNPVVVHNSAYEDYQLVDMPVTRNDAVQEDALRFENKKLRIECIKLALVACENNLDDDQHVIDTMKRYWRFVRTGD
jgi:hypothetical protein